MNNIPTLPSDDQIKRFAEILKESKISKESMQGLIENPGLLKIFAMADKSKIDKYAFEEYLSCVLDLSDHITGMVKQRNIKRNWGFSDEKIDLLKPDIQMLEKNKKHDETITVFIWLGNIDHTINELYFWQQEGIRNIGGKIECYAGLNNYSFYSGCYGKEKIIKAVKLKVHHNEDKNVSLKDLRSSKDEWPGIELLAMAALNTGSLLGVNYKLAIDSYFILGLKRKDNMVLIIEKSKREKQINLTAIHEDMPSSVYQYYSYA